MSITDLVNWGNKSKWLYYIHTGQDDVSLPEHSMYQQCTIKRLSCQKGWTKSLKANCRQCVTNLVWSRFFPVPYVHSSVPQSVSVWEAGHGGAVWAEGADRRTWLWEAAEEMITEHKQLQAVDTLQSTQYLELYK